MKISYILVFCSIIGCLASSEVIAQCPNAESVLNSLKKSGLKEGKMVVFNNEEARKEGHKWKEEYTITNISDRMQVPFKRADYQNARVEDEGDEGCLFTVQASFCRHENPKECKGADAFRSGSVSFNVKKTGTE